MGGRCAISLLGGFGVAVNGRSVPTRAWRHRRAADLIKLLALAPAHRLHREQVMDALDGLPVPDDETVDGEFEEIPFGEEA